MVEKENQRMKRGLVMVVLVLLVGTGGPTDIRAQDATPVTGADLGELVLPPDAPAYGLTYAAWTARFAQWAHSLPAAIHPAADPTGELCGLGQAGPVFFLVQAGEQEAVERTCTVPAGTALLLPLLDASCTTVEPPPFFGRDEAAVAGLHRGAVRDSRGADSGRRRRGHPGSGTLPRPVGPLHGGVAGGQHCWGLSRPSRRGWWRATGCCWRRCRWVSTNSVSVGGCRIPTLPQRSPIT